MNTWSKPNLPEELLQEILYQLPVESLFRFRAVSSSWRALIDHPDFGPTHLARYNNNRLCTHLFVIQGVRAPQCLVKSSHNFRTTARLGSLYITNLRQNPAVVVGSVNGLFMQLRGLSELVLWNPSTRRTRYVISSPDHFRHSNTEMLDFGLGFDPLANDYKHVRLVKDDNRGVRFVDIYTVGTHSSKTIELQGEGYSSWRQEFHFVHPKRSFCLRGVLYALATDQLRLNLIKLVSFDLNKELFASTGVPDVAGDDQKLDWQNLALTVADGGCSLAMVYLLRPEASIWVSQNVGGDLSSLIWIQCYTFYVEFDRIGRCLSKFLYLERNGKEEVLLLSNGKVISYNLKTHEKKIILSKNLQEGTICPYMENMIPL